MPLSDAGSAVSIMGAPPPEQVIAPAGGTAAQGVDISSR
jgi:hypothetical protein